MYMMSIETDESGAAAIGSADAGQNAITGNVETWITSKKRSLSKQQQQQQQQSKSSTESAPSEVKFT